MIEESDIDRYLSKPSRHSLSSQSIYDIVKVRKEVDQDENVFIVSGHHIS